MDFTFRRIYRGSVQAVIFDLAGTTFDYGSCAPAGSFIELFQRHKMQITNHFMLEHTRGPVQKGFICVL